MLGNAADHSDLNAAGHDPDRRSERTPDIISRVIAQQLATDKDWNVVVENTPGAVMTIAGTEVLRQPADGSSIYAMSLPVSAAPAFVPDMPFNLSHDFMPLIKVAVSYNVLVVNPNLPVYSVSDLVALLKSKPDRLTFSSGGYGTPAHLIGELFEQRTGTHAIHVPYQQFPQAIGDGFSSSGFRSARSIPCSSRIFIPITRPAFPICG
ncbi:MAG: tripartite tricarboxylate transporter substrate-binding protein [Xanthobacteraceae bacterium]